MQVRTVGLYGVGVLCLPIFIEASSLVSTGIRKYVSRFCTAQSLHRCFRHLMAAFTITLPCSLAAQMTQTHAREDFSATNSGETQIAKTLCHGCPDGCIEVIMHSQSSSLCTFNMSSQRVLEEM